jgi:hypothetical protein
MEGSQFDTHDCEDFCTTIVRDLIPYGGCCCCCCCCWTYYTREVQVIEERSAKWLHAFRSSEPVQMLIDSVITFIILGIASDCPRLRGRLLTTTTRR